MFFKKRQRRKQAEDLLKLLYAAWREVQPNRFVTPTDEALFLGPKLATLNSLVGSVHSHQAVSIENIYSAVQRYEKAGLADQVSNLVLESKDIVTGAIFCVYRREYELREKENIELEEIDLQIIEIAERIIFCINRISKAKAY